MIMVQVIKCAAQLYLKCRISPRDLRVKHKPCSSSFREGPRDPPVNYAFNFIQLEIRDILLTSNLHPHFYVPKLAASNRFDLSNP